MQVGDMVLLVGIDENSPAHQKGLRKGAIGTVMGIDSPLSWCPYNVSYPSGIFSSPIHHIRKIGPPEAADGWKYCVFQPKVKELETT